MAMIDAIKRARNTKHFAAGEIIFSEGATDSECMYVVETGQVEIANTKRVLEVIEPGGFFGEMALLDDKPRSATATAKTACVVIEINQGDFYFLVQHSPHFVIELMRTLSERVRRNAEA